MPFSYSDLVVPVPVVDVITRLSSSKSAFFGTGVAVVEENDQTGRGGNFITRKYGDEDAAAAIPIDGTEQTPALIGAFADMAPVLRRMRYRRAVDGAAAAEGGALALNPTDRILNQTIDFWAAEWDRAILATLAAAFGSGGPLAATHLEDVAVGTGTAVPLSFARTIAAATRLGDRSRDLRILVTHSKVAADLLLEAGARPLATPIGSTPFATDLYVGNLQLVVSDRCPVSGSGTYAEYTSFAIAPGAIWAAEQQMIREFVKENPAIPSIDYTQSWHRAIGISGLKWAVTDVNPDDTELADATNWELTISPMTDASRKSVGLIAITTNSNS